MIAANNILNALFMVMAAVLLMLFYKVGYEAKHVSLVLGIMSFILSFIFYHLFSEKGLRYFGEVLSNTFYKLKIEGRENLPENGPYILLSNHVSFVDWLLLMATCHRPVRFIIDHTYYYMPMGPFWFKQAKLIPIARKRDSAEILEKAFKWVENDLEKGAVLGIFPEGKISKNGELSRFQPGITKIISRSPVPIVPVVLLGVWGSTFSHKNGLFNGFNLFKKREITIKVLKPIDPREFNLLELEKLFRKEIGTKEEGIYC